MAVEGVVTLGIGSQPGGVTDFITLGLTPDQPVGPESIIMLGIGSDPGSLLNFITVGLFSLAAPPAPAAFGALAIDVASNVSENIVDLNRMANSVEAVKSQNSIEVS